MRYVTTQKEPVVISRSGEVLIVDSSGREKERHKVPYGATLSVVDGDKVNADNHWPTGILFFVRLLPNTLVR